MLYISDLLHTSTTFQTTLSKKLVNIYEYIYEFIIILMYCSEVDCLLVVSFPIHHTNLFKMKSMAVMIIYLPSFYFCVRRKCLSLCLLSILLMPFYLFSGYNALLCWPKSIIFYVGFQLQDSLPFSQLSQMGYEMLSADSEILIYKHFHWVITSGLKLHNNAAGINCDLWLPGENFQLRHHSGLSILIMILPIYVSPG